MLNNPSLIMFYVNSVPQSTDFYCPLLGTQPIESSPVFAMFSLESGLKLGLWSKDAVIPKTVNTGGGAELVFTMKSADVDSLYQKWKKLNIAILQSPTMMDFGYTFVAQDIDGHRLRVYSPNNS